jgi:hypothetical protein
MPIVKDKKKRKKMEELFHKIIGKREKKASKLMQKGLTYKQSLTELESKQDEARARTPEAIAQKSLDIEQAKTDITKRNVQRGEKATADFLTKKELTDEKGFIQKLKDFGVNKEAQAAALEKERSGEGTSIIEDIIGGAPKTAEEAVSFAGDVLGVGIPGAGRVISGAAGMITKGAGKIAPEVFSQEKALVNLLKGNPLRKLEPGTRAVRRELLASKYARMGGGRHDDAIRAINAYNKWSEPQILKFLSSKPVVIGGATMLGIGVSIMGFDSIASWYALDNIASRSTFIPRTCEEAITTGTIKEDGTPFTLEDARELFVEADWVYDLAIKKVNSFARYNPISFGARKLVMEGIKADRALYEVQKQTFFSKWDLS